MNRLAAELTRVFGDPPVAPRAVVRVQVASGQGLAAGREEADRFVDAGADLVVLDAELDSPAVLAAVAALLDLEPVTVVGTQPGPDWKERVVAVRTLLLQVHPHRYDAAAVIEVLGDLALGRLVGLLAQLAARRTPV
ncbi:MAG: nicotinate-nucleotide--dimethylbenzimidazole phosphoribosyltransferase, partial [Mycobacteriales bacterium]